MLVQLHTTNSNSSQARQLMTRLRNVAFLLGFGLSCLAVLGVGLGTVHAASVSWDNDGEDGNDTNFNNGANWIPNGVPGLNDNATFTGTSIINPNLTGSVTIQGITFASGSSGYNLSASPTFSLTLTNTGTGASSAINASTSGTNTISAPIILGNAAATTSTITQATGGTLILSGNISSTNAITGIALPTGGVYTLSGTNSYNGTTALGNATLNLNSNSALGTGNLVIGTAGAILNNTSGSAKTLANGLSAGTAFTFTGTNDLTFNGASAFTASTTHTTAGGRLTLNGGVNFGTFRTIKNGAGTLVLNGAGTGAGVSVNVGSTTVPYVQTMRIDAGFVEVGHNNAFSTGVVEIRTNGGLSANTPVTLPNNFILSTGNAVFGGTNNMTFNGNFFISNGAGSNAYTLFVTNTGTTKVNGSVSLTDVSATDSQTFTIDVAATAGATEFAGTIQNSSAGGSSVGALVKANSGMLTLSGNSTYTGTTDVQNGTMQLTGSLATATALNLGNGTNSGVFMLGGSGGAKNQTVARLITTGTGTANAVVGGNAAVSTLTVSGATSGTFAGVLGGVGANANNLGLTKAGTSTLTLTGTSTYTGPTSVTAGTLSLSGTGSINGTSGITVNGSAAKFLQIGTASSTAPITLTQGTVDGTGAVGAITVGNGTGGIVANGNGGVNALTMSSLSFSGAGTANVKVAQANPLSAGLVVAGALATTPANGQVTINPSTDTGLWPTSGLVNLINFGSFGGNISNFTLGTVNGLTSRQSTGGLILNGNNIALSITGDAPKWTGKDSNNWATGLNGTLKNWELITAGTPTDYVNLDTVLFDDTATGSTVVDLGTAVAPGSATFNNSSKNYTINSAGGFGITSGSLIKSGTGSLTINTANTYAAGTAFNGGTLNIGNAGAIGSGAFVVGTGSAKVLDNSSGAPLTLTSNVTQNWNDDFTFAGTNQLTMGTGTVTLSGASRTVTVNNSLLTVGGIAGGTTPLTLNGTGTLALRTSTLAGLSGNGRIENSGGANATLTVNQAIDTEFSGSLNNSSLLDASTLVLTKQGTGTLKLSGVSSYGNTGTTVSTNLSAGKIIVANSLGLGTGLIAFGTGTGTLDIALNEGEDLVNLWQTSTGAGSITLMSGRATPGPGVNHSLTNNVVGGGTITIAQGSNVTSGTATLTLNDINMTAGSAATTTFNPTTANVIISDVDNGASTSAQARTLELGGTSNGTITGNVNRTVGTLAINKTNTSTWTLLGTNNIYDSTTITSGVLNIGNGGTGGTLSSGAVTNNATLNFNRSDELVVSSPISGTTGTINQVGSGSTVLSGVSTYSGQTNINAGKLVVTGSLNNSPVAVNNGTLDGTGSVGAVTVADSTANHVANGNGATGDLVLSSLTFAGDARVDVRVSSPGLVVTGALTTTPANGTVVINPTAATGFWADGANNLISFGSFGGNISNFSLGTITGTLGPRQSYGSLLLNGNNIALQVNGDTARWTGALSNVWSTAVLANPKNWKLLAAGTGTDYLEGDNVRFDDTATSTAVNISAANVSPTSTTFNNNTLNYTVSSTGAFGIAGIGSVTKNGSGSVTISTNNSYTGATNVNNGTLTLTGANTSSSSTNVNGSGTLRLDFSAATAPVSDIASNSSQLTLGGGNLTLVGKASTSNTQSFASTHANQGGSTINMNADANGNPLVLHLGTITRSTGSSVVFTLPNGSQDFSNGVTTSNANFNGLLGPGGVISSPGAAANNSATGYTFATVSGGNIVPYTSATPLSANGTGVAWGGIPAGGDGTVNYDVDATAPANIGSARNVNTIRYTGTGITQPGSAALTINGLMNAGTGPVTVNQPMVVGAVLDMTLAAATAPINVTTAISNNGSSPSAITVMGPNTVTLTGTSAYTGSTNVNGGTLVIGGAGSVEASSGFNINGNGAKLLYTSTTASSRPIALVQGTLDGTSTVGTVTVSDGTGVVANGNGGSTPLGMSSLTFNGGGKMSVHVNTSTPTTAAMTTGPLTANGAAGSVIVDVTPHGAWSYNTTYTLANYAGLIGGTGFSAFTKGTVTGISSRTTATLGNAGNAITLAIGPSARIVWTGADSNTWSTGLNGTLKNWKLESNNSPTDFLNNDDVVFNDTSSSTTVNISGAPVNVAFATFNNSAQSYTINGNGIASGGIEKSGTGALTINTANTYALGTEFKGGTLNVGNAGALGVGSLTIGAGSAKTLNNTSGGPLTLSTGITQNWNDDFAFTGTSDLNMGSGAVTLGGAGAARTVTVNSGVLGVGAVSSASGSGKSLTKLGTGTLAIDGDAPNVIEGDVNVNSGSLTIADQSISIGGNLNVTGGNFAIGGQSVTVAGTINVGAGSVATVGATPSATGLAGTGTISNGSAPNGAIVVNTTVNSTFGGTIENGAGGGTLGLTKQGAATLTLAGNSTYSGNTALQAGTLVMAHPNALGVVTSTNLLTVTSGATFEIATDNIGNTDTAYQMTMGTGSTATLVSNRATPGPGISHPITTSADPAVSTLGLGTINFVSGANVTSGSGNISFIQLNSSAGSAGTITLNPTTATVTVGSMTRSSAGVNAVTFDLGGTNTGNQVTGAISNGVASINSVTKTNTSTWTLLGESSYTGGTTVSGGTLLVNNTTGSGTGTGPVTVSGGTLGGTGIIDSSPTGSNVVVAGGSIAPGVAAGTLTFSTGGGSLDLSGLTAGGLKFDIGASQAASDLISLTSGTLNVGTLNFSEFAFASLGGISVGNTYTLVDAQSAITGSIGTATGSFGGFAAAISLDPTNFDVKLSITGLAALAGDHDNNGVVDARDYVVWRQNPAAYGGATGYTAWRSNFGATGGSGSGGSLSGTGVPEPGTCVLLLVAAGALAGTRRSRRSAV
jgi:autotransporter-associated beta strand protein